MDGTTWSDIAQWYDELVSSGRSPHGTAVATTLELAGDVQGLRVLDVGCGQGSATRALARAGALVTGADATPELLAAAREHETADAHGITYVLADAQRLEPFPDGGVDLVTCQLALMDIPDLDAALRSVRRVLRPDGAFVAVISHPCFLAPFAQTVPAADGRPGRLVADYLREEFWRSPNPDGVRRAGAYHRTLSTYLNALVRHGFALEATLEPAASGAYAQAHREYTQVPIFLGLRVRRR
jgi:ubiquinone/menaquinone biosynthesis C-methylase UbiE